MTSSGVTLYTFWVWFEITIISTLFLLIFSYIVSFRHDKANFLPSYNVIF